MASVAYETDNCSSLSSAAASRPSVPNEHSRQILHSSTVRRLDTFANAFSQFNSAVSKSDWAQMGFYYDSESSSVRCVSCPVTVFSSWETSTPEAVQRLHQPGCEFSSSPPLSLTEELVDGPMNETYDRIVDLGSRQTPNPIHAPRLSATAEERAPEKRESICIIIIMHACLQLCMSYEQPRLHCYNVINTSE